jgi:hypothetical protein
VLVELANEVWNQPGSLFMQVLTKNSGIQGYDNPLDSWLVRGRRVVDRVKAVFADKGRGDEVKFVVAYQSGGVGTPLNRIVALNAAGAGIDLDVVSSAPYTWADNTQTHIDAYNNADDEQCNDIWLFDLEFYGARAGQSLRNDGVSRRAFEASAGRSIEFIHYEGGLDSTVPKPFELINNGFTRNMDVMYNPVRYFVEYDYPYVLNRVGGTDGIAIFNHCQAPLGPLSIPGGTYFALWGATEYHGQQPGRGDGSDGKADNRLFLHTPGKPGSKHPTVNQA